MDVVCRGGLEKGAWKGCARRSAEGFVVDVQRGCAEGYTGVCIGCGGVFRGINGGPHRGVLRG